MNLGDLNKVWEIKTLKRKPNEEAARKMLENIAKQVQPIMVKHKWRVKVLSEFCPKNARLLGLNVGAGVHVKLRLRRPNKDEEFIPFNQVLDTMLHELCHNSHGPHNASFYNLWDELRKECEDLISKGISGSGMGFDLPGKRLGGFSSKPPLSTLRQTTLAAAEKRVRLGSLLLSGPKRLGGDSSLMAALSPLQAAAMAAERRLQDNIWCGAESYDASEEKDEENNDEKPLEMVSGVGSSRSSGGSSAPVFQVLSQKRKHWSGGTPSSESHGGPLEPMVVDLTNSTSTLESTNHHHEVSKRIRQSDNSLHAPASNSAPSRCPSSTYGSHGTEESTMWECGTCTLLNPSLAPVCKVCCARKAPDIHEKHKFWSCKFCTLDNTVELDRCGACGEWRYSHGPPVATVAPNRGT